MNASAPSLPLFELPVESAVEERTPSRTRTRRRKSWLAVHFHQWPLYAALNTLNVAQRTELLQQAVAVLDNDRQRRVVACNAIAWQQGIRLGHALNAAIALCADTHFLMRDPAREQRLLESMAVWAQRFTPCVNIEIPNELLLEVRGSLKLFGGVGAFMQCMRTELHQQGIVASLALSATSRSALWIARRSIESSVVTPRALKAQLSDIAIQHLHWPADVELRLIRFGVRTIGDLLRLPRADLARRIGKVCMHELSCALGREPEIKAAFQAPEPYHGKVILDFEISATASLEPIFKQYLQTLARYLRTRTLELDHVHFELKHRDRSCTPVHIGLASPTADMRHVTHLASEQLAKLQLPAPVVEVQLQVLTFLAARNLSADFFSKKTEHAPHLQQHEKLGRLLEQLRARLGDTAIRRLHVKADHRPDHAQCPLAATADLNHSSSQALPVLTPRPLWLLNKPLLLSNHQLASIHLLRGPERIETGWWDAATVQRDYYVASNEHGVVGWVFMDRSVTPATWYLHGLFG